MAALAPLPYQPPAPPAAPDYAGTVAIVNDLGRLVAEKRAGLGLDPKTAAKQVKVTSATLTRLESGSTPTRTTIVAALNWLAEH